MESLPPSSTMNDFNCFHRCKYWPTVFGCSRWKNYSIKLNPIFRFICHGIFDDFQSLYNSGFNFSFKRTRFRTVHYYHFSFIWFLSPSRFHENVCSNDLWSCSPVCPFHNRMPEFSEAREFLICTPAKIQVLWNKASKLNKQWWKLIRRSDKNAII